MAESLVETIRYTASLSSGRAKVVLEDAASAIEGLIAANAKAAEWLAKSGEEKNKLEARIQDYMTENLNFKEEIRELYDDLTTANQNADYWQGEYHSAVR